MTLPSKELLSEVLGIDVAKIIDNTHERTISVYERDFKYPCTYNASAYITINIYELAFLTRNYLHKKYGYSLDMSLEIGEIFKNATQFYESML